MGDAVGESALTGAVGSNEQHVTEDFTLASREFNQRSEPTHYLGLAYGLA